MPRGRDQAGNIWEIDDQGKPVRLIQAAQAAPSTYPGALGVVPPNPAIVAQKAREQARQDASDRRAEASNERSAQAEARAQKDFESKNELLPPPGDASKTGEEYLATLPQGLAAQVRAVAEGRRALPTSGRMNPAMQQLIAAATQYDPTLDAANAATRVATRKKFTSGTTRDNITAINTALGHLGTLYKDSQKLENRDFPLWNTLANAAESATGDPRVSNFNLTKHAVVDELEKAFRGSGGTQTGIDEWSKSINSSQSPDQLRGAIGKAVELLQSRLEALGQAYEQGLGKSADPLVFLNPHAQAVFNALGPGGDGNVPDIPKGGSGAPPILGGSDKPPPPQGPTGPPKVGPSPDFSGMTDGGPQAAPATGQTRNEYDPITSAGMSSLVRKGRPYEEAAAYAKSKGFKVPDPATYAAAIAYHKQHPEYKGSFAEATKPVPTTGWQRLAGGPVAAGASGAATAATAGFNDELAGGINYLGGGDYTEGRDAFNATKNILAEQHPGWDLGGQVVGGFTSGLGMEAAAARAMPGALAAGGRVFGRFAPVAGDAAYGAAYGAGENNEDRLGGGVSGLLAGGAGGAVGRGATRGLANVISPPAGVFGPAYAQGVFPTVGQRFGRSGLAGRAINTVEQAMQSFPGLGALVSRARQIPRDQFQVGAFNDALGDINQQLPHGVGPGTDAHAFASRAFNNAYARARQGMQFVPDPQYQADTQALAQRVTSGVLNPQQAQQVSDVIRNSVTGRLRTTGGVLDGASYQQAGTELGDAISAWSHDGTTQPMANALRDYQTIFDNAARRNSNPAAVQLLDQADRGYAKLVRIQDAARRVGGDAGTFTPRGFDRSVQNTAGGVRSGPYLRGDALMQDYADAGRGLTDTLPNSGSAERLLTGQAVAGTGGFALGAPAAIAAHPLSLAPFAAYAPGANAAITRAIAPRSATLPPIVADFLERTALGTRNRAPFVGRMAVPGALALEFNQ